ncbi:Fn3 and Ig 3 and c2-set 2 and i-set and Ig 2 doma in containing protein [Plakobranchus ocellatus]|uniref:Fn3 and Ig 3 and c2-set 2 and i-set and Ig 2 doma in containing protein n=1 Tax=Plakobranchus ocellatus TaxID=259542 RepID=A0AAV4ASH4_9GAST|nr:Fn3 and Ig 3 and c2-set 2 and i-set and Ig 2 doma in containing protein [Plakobranchus ocellatus]
MKVFTGGRYYWSAENTCKSFKGGSSEDQPGWLVIIPDSDTDEFVKRLLHEDQEAYIGLYEDKGTFSWRSGYRYDATYRGWKDEQPESSIIYSYNYATIGKEGWESSTNKERPYICQMYPALPHPSITCPPTQEGTSNLKVECEIPMQTSYGQFERVEIGAYEKYPALYCTPLNCVKFTNNLYGTISEDNEGNTLTATFMLDRPINRSDDRQKWSSKYKYDSSPEFVLFTDCIMRTYVVPQSPACSFNYTVSDGFTITCDVHGVYPKAGSTWLHFINNDKQSNLQIQPKHEAYTQAGLTMYKSKFKTQIKGEAKAMPGQHTIEVTVYPDVPFVNQEKRRTASMTKTVEFSISVPNQPPLFYNGSGLNIIQDRLTVNSGQTITLICKVEGGDPPLYDIRISCNNTVQGSSGKNTWSSPGQQVSAVLPISQAMDQKMCNCSANHVSGQYRKQAYVTLNVLHAAEVVSFTINGQKREFEASENETIKFRCSAVGNPKPNLILFQTYSGGRINYTLSKTFGNNIDFNISKASCDTSGTYVCAAENNLSIETSERTVSVRVKCRPQPCSESYGDREFSVLPDTQAEVTLCIFAYPQPNSDIRLRRMGGNNFGNSFFNARFVYTDAVKSKGNVMINMTVSIAKRGNYTLFLLQTNAWYKIPFSLVPYQKPSCPKSLNIERVGSSFVVLSWIPAPDRGISQTFTVSHVDHKGVVVEGSDVEDIGELQMFHNITGLTSVSEYWFNLSVKNVEGLTDCPHLVVNATTDAIPVSAEQSENANVWMVLGAIVAVVVVILLMAALVYVLIMKRKSEKSHLVLSSDEKLGKAQEPRDDDGMACSTALNGDVYAVVNKPPKKAENEEINVYSNNVVVEMQGTNEPKKDSKSQNTSVLDGSNHSPDGTHAVPRTQDKKFLSSAGNSVAESSQIYANSTVSYQSNSVPEHELTQKESQKLEGVSSSSKLKTRDKNQRKTEGKKAGKTKEKDDSVWKDSGGNQGKNELVYMEVEIIPGQGQRRVQLVEEKVEPVDYATIAFQGSDKADGKI